MDSIVGDYICITFPFNTQPEYSFWIVLLPFCSPHANTQFLYMFIYSNYLYIWLLYSRSICEFFGVLAKITKRWKKRLFTTNKISTSWKRKHARIAHVEMVIESSIAFGFKRSMCFQSRLPHGISMLYHLRRWGWRICCKSVIIFEYSKYSGEKNEKKNQWKWKRIQII